MRATELARQRTAETLLEQRLGLPGVGEDVRRVGREHLRVFDAGDAPGRNGEHLHHAVEILQYRYTVRLAPGKVDVLAGLGAFPRFGVGLASVVHDPPQSQRVRAGDDRGERQADREQERGRQRSEKDVAVTADR